MPKSNSQPKPIASKSVTQLTSDSESPPSEPRVNPIFWIMGLVFAVLLGIVFFIINALSVYP